MNSDYKLTSCGGLMGDLERITNNSTISWQSPKKAEQAPVQQAKVEKGHQWSMTPQKNQNIDQCRDNQLSIKSQTLAKNDHRAKIDLKQSPTAQKSDQIGEKILGWASSKKDNRTEEMKTDKIAFIMNHSSIGDRGQIVKLTMPEKSTEQISADKSGAKKEIRWKSEKAISNKIATTFDKDQKSALLLFNAASSGARKQLQKDHPKTFDSITSTNMQEEKKAMARNQLEGKSPQAACAQIAFTAKTDYTLAIYMIDHLEQKSGFDLNSDMTLPLNEIYLSLNNLDDKLVDAACKQIVDDHPEIAFSLAKVGLTKEIAGTVSSSTLLRDNTAATKLFSNILKKEFNESMEKRFKDKSYAGTELMNPFDRAVKLDTLTEDEKIKMDDVRQKVQGAVDIVLDHSLEAIKEGSSEKTRELFNHLHDEVSKKFPDEAKKQVAAMFFLRYQSVMITVPKAIFPNDPGYASRDIHNNAILISGVLQKMANFNLDSQTNATAPFMEYIKNVGPEKMNQAINLLTKGHE